MVAELYYTDGMEGKELRSIRQRLDWTQVELAQAIGVDPNTIARYERGELGISEPVARLVGLIAQSSSKKRKQKRGVRN